MTIRRLGAPLARLPSGKVLLAGGGFSVPVASAEVFDPASSTWSLLPASLVNARFAHTATELMDGRILFSGGASPSFAPVAFAEIFDPVTGQFSETGPMVLPRFSQSATRLLDGRVLVAGGSTSALTNSAEIYSPSTGAWTATSPMLGPGWQNETALLPDGRVIVLVFDWGVQVFNPDGGSWTQTGPLSLSFQSGEGKGRALTSLPDGGVLICGGSPESSVCEMYVASTNTWIQTGSMKIPRTETALVLMKNGKVLAVGGSNPPDGGQGNFTPVFQSEIFW